MPRIKRWFPVSHDINHSPTVRQLVKRFGAPGLRVWLEILSIADRCGPVVDISSPGALSRLASAAETRLRTVSDITESLLRAGSVRSHDLLNHLSEIVNYWDYHRTWEQNRVPSGPDLTRPLKEKTATENSPVVDNSTNHARETRVSFQKKNSDSEDRGADALPSSRAPRTTAKEKTRGRVRGALKGSSEATGRDAPGVSKAQRRDAGKESDARRADPFRAIALEIMGRDVRRFQRLPAFISRAFEDRYSSEVISECLRRLLNAIERGQIDGDWWAYARAILVKAYEDDMQRKYEALKRAEAEFLPRQGEIFAPHLDD